MRVLVIDDEAIEKVRRVIAYARRHVYYPGFTDTVPGDNPEHVVKLNSFRCVFTFTKSHGGCGNLYRHLSISVPSKDYPNPAA